MPQNKKHHYVPRFLLKRFSRDGHSVGLYNIPSRRMVSHAGLKNQCYSDYLYGKNTVVEKALAGAEGLLAELLREMDLRILPPPPFTRAHQALVFLVLSQRGRTLYAAEALDEMLDKITKNIYGDMFEKQGVALDKFSISYKEPAAFALAMMLQLYPLLWDMEYKVLVNKTAEEFIISDNPVVFYNQLLSFRRDGSNCGVASKGLQIFVPLDPKKVLVLYDNKVYRMGSDAKGAIDVTNPRDVYELNTLQFVSSKENIYFSDPNFGVGALHKKATPFMRQRKASATSFESMNEPDTKYIRSSAEDIRTNFDVSFITLRHSTKEWLSKLRRQRYQPAVFIRNECLVKDHEAFLQACEKGEYQHSQFEDFVKERIEAAKTLKTAAAAAPT
jgi:hypothetical protein